MKRACYIFVIICLSISLNAQEPLLIEDSSYSIEVLSSEYKSSKIEYLVISNSAPYRIEIRNVVDSGLVYYHNFVIPSSATYKIVCEFDTLDRVKLDPYFAQAHIVGLAPDTVWLIDYDKLSSYFEKNKSRICTIWVEDSTIFQKQPLLKFKKHFNSADLLALQYYEMKNEVLNGEFLEFYDLKELNGTIINDNFKLRFEGRYSNGKKVGKWIEYTPSGSIIKTIKY